MWWRRRGRIVRGSGYADRPNGRAIEYDADRFPRTEFVERKPFDSKFTDEQRGDRGLHVPFKRKRSEFTDAGSELGRGAPVYGGIRSAHVYHHV